MITDPVVFAFILTFFAGISTGIGGLMAFFTRETNNRFLSLALGFSAGVMIYVSMIEIFRKAQESLVSAMGKTQGSWITALSFFAGFIFIALIDRFVPSAENPHEVKKIEDMEEDPKKLEDTKLMRMGLFTALAVGLHNFPEGLVTFVAAIKDPSLGIAVAVAVAIHNIPEGIAVSVPIYYATGDRKKALLYSFLSGFAEPVGALVGFLLFARFFGDAFFGVIFAAAAGIMVFISLDELLPAAREYGEPHLSIYGLLGGMMVMAISILLFL